MFNSVVVFFFLLPKFVLERISLLGHTMVSLYDYFPTKSNSRRSLNSDETKILEIIATIALPFRSSLVTVSDAMMTKESATKCETFRIFVRFAF